MSNRGLLRLLLLVLHSLPNASSAYRILLMPLPAGSHVMSLVYIGQSLVQRGHDVHMLVPEGFKLAAELSSSESRIGVERYGAGMEQVSVGFRLLGPWGKSLW